MLLGGLWHGAAWNFIFWGAWQGIGLLAHRWWEGRVRTRPRGWPVVSWVLTMLFVLYGWLLFRANSLDQLLSYTMALGHWHYPPWIGSYLLNLTMFSLPLVLMQVWQARTGNLLVAMTLPFWVLATLEGLLLVSIGVYWGHAATPFIYFQF
jgi:hypothetical protein